MMANKLHFLMKNNKIKHLEQSCGIRATIATVQDVFIFRAMEQRYLKLHDIFAQTHFAFL